MNSSKAALAAVALAVLLGGALWFGLNRKSPPAVQTQAEPVVPPNAAHEKASLVEQLRKMPGHAPVLLRLAEIATEQGQPAEARGRLEELLMTEPNHLEARLELGRACYELDDLPCAIAETEKVLAQDPKHVDALYNLGAIHANSGDAAKARQYWRKAVQVAPDSASGQKSAAASKQLGDG
ncbi:tetratricopeptide repeat protein [Paludibaculum fermentans]|uniref:tetratricopeptide repeat protein n=1 Tax=Paludibaculum fermentans TaxID=1473598 RepID=UPI003EBC9B16